jgi:hypothetical protein
MLLQRKARSTRFAQTWALHEKGNKNEEVKSEAREENIDDI